MTCTITRYCNWNNLRWENSVQHHLLLKLLSVALKNNVPLYSLKGQYCKEQVSSLGNLVQRFFVISQEPFKTMFSTSQQFWKFWHFLFKETWKLNLPDKMLYLEVVELDCNHGNYWLRNMQRLSWRRWQDAAPNNPGFQAQLFLAGLPARNKRKRKLLFDERQRIPHFYLTYFMVHQKTN